MNLPIRLVSSVELVVARITARGLVVYTVHRFYRVLYLYRVWEICQVKSLQLDYLYSVCVKKVLMLKMLVNC